MQIVHTSRPGPTEVQQMAGCLIDEVCEVCLFIRDRGEVLAAKFNPWKEVTEAESLMKTGRKSSSWKYEFVASRKDCNIVKLAFSSLDY